jgi:hypothetical protein
VTPQVRETYSSDLHLSVENPSSIFDMRDVTLACRLLRLETGEASKDLPVTIALPTNTGVEGMVLSEKRNFTIEHGKPVTFDCGGDTIASSMERGGRPYSPPRIEVEVIVRLRTLWFRPRAVSAGPFTAIRSGDKYQWTVGETIKAEPVR